MIDLRTGTRSWFGSVGRVVRQPVLRRVLPGMLVSALGDGMSMVAVAWAAAVLDLGRVPQRVGHAVGIAVVALQQPSISLRSSRRVAGISRSASNRTDSFRHQSVRRTAGAGSDSLCVSARGALTLYRVAVKSQGE